MSTANGRAFVLSLAIVPPLIATLRVFINPNYFYETPKTVLAFYAILYVYAVYRITIPYLTSPLRGLPVAPNDSFLFGHIKTEFTPPRGSAFIRWIKEVPNSGMIAFNGPFHMMPNILLTSAEAIHEVLLAHTYDWEKIAFGRKLLSRTTGFGLITVEGAEHKLQRKSVTPAFTGKQIKELIPLFWAKSQELMKVIAEGLDLPAGDEKKSSRRTGIVEINSWASRVTLDIIGVACVGREFGALYNSEDEFVKHYDKILVTAYMKEWKIPFYFFMTYFFPPSIGRYAWFFPTFAGSSEARYQLRPLCRRLIAIKRQDMQTESDKHIDILSVLIRSGQFTDDGLVDQLLTFLAAGHETTSGAFTWASWLLATHPDVQTKLRAELQAHFSSSASDHKIDAASLDNLPYLSAVASEQLRLWPTVPVTGRIAVRDTTLLGQRIPKGTSVAISPWAINRSEKFWGADAAEFNPERWMAPGQGATGGGAAGALSQITFLHGPRSCIGQAFSRAELKCLIAALVMRFEVVMADPSEKVVPGGAVTIKPRNGLRLRLTEL